MKTSYTVHGTELHRAYESWKADIKKKSILPEQSWTAKPPANAEAFRRAISKEMRRVMCATPVCGAVPTEKNSMNRLKTLRKPIMIHNDTCEAIWRLTHIDVTIGQEFAKIVNFTDVAGFDEETVSIRDLTNNPETYPRKIEISTKSISFNTDVVSIQNNNGKVIAILTWGVLRAALRVSGIKKLKRVMETNFCDEMRISKDHKSKDSWIITAKDGAFLWGDLPIGVLATGEASEEGYTCKVQIEANEEYFDLKDSGGMQRSDAYSSLMTRIVKLDRSEEDSVVLARKVFSR